MIFYFIRHGQTVDNARAVFPDENTKLTDKGIKEAKTASKFFGNIKFDAIYTSPFLRTLETAKILTEKRYIIDKRLKDVDTGTLKGESIEEISKKDKNWYTTFRDDIENKYNVERFSSVKERINDFINETGKNNYSRVLVVTHLEPIRAMFSISMDIDGKALVNIEINNCSVSLFTYFGSKLYLKSLNWIPLDMYDNNKNSSFY